MGPKKSRTEIRSELIAAARALTARQGDFSLKQLYAQSGIGKTGFYRCFTGKEELTAAIVQGDVQVLGEMVQAMEPVPVQSIIGQQVANGPSSMERAVAAPQVDAWLERRLRVFERALAALETRQEQSERDAARNFALLEEKIVTPELAPDESALFIEEAAPAQVAPMIAEAVDEAPVVETSVAETPLAEIPAFEPPPEKPISDTEIQDFIAQARAAAKRASMPPVRAPAVALPRWIAWMGVVAVTLMICAGLALGNVARATQAEPRSGVAYRDEPHDSLGRMMALADSGDARAQTVLALAYMRGKIVGIDGNDTAAMRWGLAAAKQGEPMAQYLIGTLYSKADAARAVHWYEQAALRGNLKAMHNLAIAYAQGQGVSEDDRRAAAWFNRAAAQGYVDSQFDLAVLFERGQGVAQNSVAALKWYLIAANGGDADSQARADQLEAQMPAADVERAGQMAAAWHAAPQDVPANAVGTI